MFVKVNSLITTQTAPISLFLACFLFLYHFGIFIPFHIKSSKTPFFIQITTYLFIFTVGVKFYFLCLSINSSNSLRFIYLFPSISYVGSPFFIHVIIVGRVTSR